VKVPCCHELGLLKDQDPGQRGHFRDECYSEPSQAHGYRRRSGCGVARRVAVVGDLADRTTLTGELSQGLSGLRRPRARHDPGRVLVDLAIAVADGA
jgi:hypothetical protein